MAWVSAHWKDVILAVLAVDAALIPLLPQVPFLVKVKDFLSNLVK